MATLPWDDPELLDFACTAVREKTDILKLAEKLSKSRFKDLRSEILAYIEIVPKYRKKFRTEKFLACDRLALEQSTAADIGIFKAKLFEGAGTIDDLCCGMGGDSFFLGKNFKVRGVDLSPDRIEMFRHNAQALGLSAEAVVADIRTLESRSEFFTVDPARRETLADNQRNFSELTPSLSEICEMAKLYRGGMTKLPPGYPENEIPRGTEILYIGSRSDCRECLVLFGALAKNPDTVSAVVIDSEDEAHIWNFARGFSPELPTQSPAKFLAEPLPVLVRSHLFPAVALKENADAHLISEGIAYVSSDSPFDAKAFRNFQILGTAPIATGKVRALLKEHDIGKLTLKKRGVEIVPEKEIQRLAPRGHKEAVLFYTRVLGEKTAILALPV